MDCQLLSQLLNIIADSGVVDGSGPEPYHFGKLRSEGGLSHLSLLGPQQCTCEHQSPYPHAGSMGFR